MYFSIIFLSRRIVQFWGDQGLALPRPRGKKGFSPHQKYLCCCSMSRSTCFFSKMLTSFTQITHISNQLYFQCAAQTDKTEWTLLYTSCAERKWKLKHKLIPCREASINNISISLEKWGWEGILRICSNQFAKSTGIQDDFSRLCNNVHFVWFLSNLFEFFQFLSILVNKSRFDMSFYSTFVIMYYEQTFNIPWH